MTGIEVGRTLVFQICKSLNFEIEGPDWISFHPGEKLLSPSETTNEGRSSSLSLN
jgi:hypothetical protein